MPQSSGVETAIRELEQEEKKIQQAISLLKKIHSSRPAKPAGRNRPRRRLSASARRRISEAAKKRWATLRSSKGESSKSKG